MRLVVVDLDSLDVVQEGTLVRSGTCHQCGACCENLECAKLVEETVDGVPRKVCCDYWTRPANCALWPLHDSDIPAGCGYSWTEG